MSHHARLSPSNKRWPVCPGSVREEAAYPDSTGEAAIDGTGSHLLLELCIGELNANRMLDATIGEGYEDRPQGWWVKQDRIDRVNMALSYLRRREEELGGTHVTSESQSNPGEWFARDDWYGTCDVTLFGQGVNVLEVIDYKDGQMYVDARDNSQLIAYAVGKLGEHIMQGETIPNYNCFDMVRMTIIQPKSGPPIRYVDMTVQEVWEAGKKLAARAKATDDPFAPLVSNPECKWCRHKNNCNAKYEEGALAMSELTGQQSLIDAIKTGEIAPGNMSATQLAAFKDIEKVVTDLFKAVDAEMLTRLQDNANSIPGYEIGSGRKSSAWIDDEETVAKKLRGMRLKKDEVMIPTLISPAQAKKHPGLTDRQLENVEKMIEMKPGPKKVVKAAVVVQEPAADMFMNIPLSFM